MKINISIDDVSPHPNSSTIVLEECYRLIEYFPDIKFSLFVPIAYWRTVRPDISTKFPFEIHKFTDFCDTIKNLSDKNFEVCYHGYYHGIPGKSDNDEFQNLSYESAIEKFSLMFNCVKKANLVSKFKPIFRPPAWRMSPGSFDAAEKMGIKLLALSPKDYAQMTYDNKDRSDFWKDKVVYYHSNPPFDSLAYRENLEIVYHACQWDKNFLSKSMAQDLLEFLIKNESNEFCFLEDMRE